MSQVLHSGLVSQPSVFDPSVPIAGNYKPLVHSVALEAASGDLALSVVAGQSMGCASLVDGVLEVMLHRNPGQADSQGPGPLIDPTRLTITVHLLLDEPAAVTAARPRLAARRGRPLVVAAAAHPALPWSAWVAAGYGTGAAGVAATLPAALDLVSFMVRQPDPDTSGDAVSDVVVRIRHQYERAAHATLSAPVAFNLTEWLRPTFPCLVHAPVAMSLTLLRVDARTDDEWQPLELRTFLVTPCGPSSPPSQA